MPVYKRYLESESKRRTTMVHVPELLGCMAIGPTTDSVLAATPEAMWHEWCDCTPSQSRWIHPFFRPPSARERT